ncbi:MAG TPA: response regulator [Polyangia bacterium]|nr:response regulator [Polyangia bacterium]
MSDASASRGTALSILLVDDDDTFRERLARALRERGFQVTTAANGQAALAAAAAAPPDFAVVDMRMPGGSGQEVIEGLASISPTTKSVVLSGYGSIASAVDAMNKGARHYLSKPIDADELVATLMKVGSGGAAESDPPIETTPSLARAEWEHIQRVLADCGGNISEGARRLGIARRTLQLKLKKYPPRT